MEELTTINEIISQTVKDSSYVTALISSGVFILYLIITKTINYLTAKDKNKPLIQMTKAMEQMSENLIKMNERFDKTFQDSEIKETTRINNVVSTTFNSFKSKVLSKCIDIVVYNNIEADKDSVKNNIFKTISTEYYKVYSILSDYERDSINVSSKLKEEWINNTTDECLKIIYNGLSPHERIRQLSSKLEQLVEEYSIFVTNKIFNH